MLTALQDLKQQKFTIDAEPTDTVRALLIGNHKIVLSTDDSPTDRAGEGESGR